MENVESDRSSGAFVQFGKDIASVIGGTLASYLFVQIISLSIMEESFHFLIDEKLVFFLFSYQMIPPFVAFTVLIASVYYLFNKTKRTMAQLAEHEIARERSSAFLEATQNVTSLMISHIARYNAEIRDWLMKKSERGEQPPVKVADASRKIAMALNTMSEMSHLMPYIKPGGIQVDTYSTDLEERLRSISDSSVLRIENTQ